jgi:hypothetical protein
MKWLMPGLLTVSMCLVLAVTHDRAWAGGGPFEPGEPTFGIVWEPYFPVDKSSSELVAWATGWDDYSAGSHVDSQWQDPNQALGPAEGTAFDIVSLGRRGSITLTFDAPIQNGDGWDFAVFENSFNDDFLELAYVEVSTNGADFVRFDSTSFTRNPVPGFGTIDHTMIHNLAGKYRQGKGTPFDLNDLADKSKVSSGLVDLDEINYVRIVDIVGDGNDFDNRDPYWLQYNLPPGPIYDPYPTVNSAGFDLDAVGVRYQGDPWAQGGPFEPGKETDGIVWEPYSAVDKDSSELVAWATGWQSYTVGSHVDPQWQDPNEALGPAEGTSTDIVSLGRGGIIILSFDAPIQNGEGWDFAVFENSADDVNLELAYVAVSTNGTNFIRFDSTSFTSSPVAAAGSVDYTLIHNLAGKYRQGKGTPFDLDDLSERDQVVSGLVDLDEINYVKIIDIVGDGDDLDRRDPHWGSPGPIYDPYPTTGSAGFDLDAVGIRYQGDPPDSSVAYPLLAVYLLLLNN